MLLSSIATKIVKYLCSVKNYGLRILLKRFIYWNVGLEPLGNTIPQFSSLRYKRVQSKNLAIK